MPFHASNKWSLACFGVCLYKTYTAQLENYEKPSNLACDRYYYADQ